MDDDRIRLGEVPQELYDELTRAVAPYQIALLGVRRAGGEDTITYAGSGVLVSLRSKCFLVTAAHVWKQVAQFEEFGVCIRESLHDTTIRRHDVVPYVAYKQDAGSSDLDIAFLELSDRAIRTIGEEKRYFALDDRSRNGTFPNPDDNAGLIAVVGAPAATSAISDKRAALHAGPWVGGIEKYYETNGLDYFDIGVDLGSNDLPQFFGGISGGPAWQVFLYRPRPDRKLAWRGIPELLGIVFAQSEPKGGRLTVLCHGPKSVYVEGPRLLGIA